MLWLTVKDWLVPQNFWRYQRSVVQTDVDTTGFYHIIEMVQKTLRSVILISFFLFS